MKKANSLRTALQTAFPNFTKNPDKLVMFVNNRRIEALGTGLNYKINYDLSIYIFDFAPDVAQIEIILLKWAQAFAPELLATDAARTNFATIEIELLDNKSCNLEISMALTEFVVATENENGQISGEYLSEIAFDDPFENDENVKNDHETDIPNFTNLEINIINGQ